MTVYRLIVKGTIEERILQRAKEKSEVSVWGCTKMWSHINSFDLITVANRSIAWSYKEGSSNRIH